AGGMTKLTDTELTLLVRLDGRLTLGAVRRGMAEVDADTFALAFARLRDAGLLAAQAPDTFDMHLQAGLDSFAATVGDAQADAGLLSLRRAGYFCGIARPRAHSAPSQVPGAPLTALVVEDEPVLAKFIQSYLAFEGIQTRVA